MFPTALFRCNVDKKHIKFRWVGGFSPADLFKKEKIHQKRGFLEG